MKSRARQVQLFPGLFLVATFISSPSVIIVEINRVVRAMPPDFIVDMENHRPEVCK